MEEVLWKACREGDAETVRLLLAYSCVDPSANNNAAICWAAHYDHVKVVRMLLDDDRVNALVTIPISTNACSRIIAADKHWGVEANREVYKQHLPELSRMYDAMISQCLTMAWLAKQVNTWSDIVLPWSDRVKAGFLSI